jgi:hypothetical protein
MEKFFNVYLLLTILIMFLNIINTNKEKCT